MGNEVGLILRHNLIINLEVADQQIKKMKHIS